jgi:O-antigen/teichoic acid export membrane protein
MLKSHAITGVFYAVQFVLSIVAAGMLARAIGPEARGVVAASNVLPQLLLGLVSVFVAGGVSYLTAKNPGTAGRVLGTALALGTIACGLMVVAGFLATPFLMAGYSTEEVAVARLFLIVALPGLFWVGLPSNSWLGLRRTVAFNLARLVPTGMGLGAALVCFWQPDAETYLGVYAALLAVAGIAMVFVSGRLMGAALGVSWSAARSLWDYGARGLAAGLMNVASARIDMLLATVFLTAHELGLYAVGSGLGQAAQGLLHGVGSVMMPALAGGGGAVVVVFQRTWRVSSAASVAVACIVFAVLPWLVTGVFGEAFSGAVDAARLLLVANVLAGLNWVLCDGFRGLGKPEWANLSEGAGLAARLVGLVVVMGAPSLEVLAAISVAAGVLSLGASLLVSHWLVGRWEFGRWGSELKNDLGMVLRWRGRG